MASHQIVEIAPQRGQPALRRSNGWINLWHACIRQRGQQPFYRIGKFRDAIQTDYGQRTMGLVHAGARLLQIVARRVGGVGNKTLSGAFQRQINFALDPGQRADIEISAHEKLFTVP